MSIRFEAHGGGRKDLRSQARGAGKRNLRFEHLEERSLLAVAAFHVNLYDDVGGSPGQLITEDAVELGDTFFVEIMARELHPVRAGFAGIALDLAWDPNVLVEIDGSLSATITPHFPLYRDGTLDNETGTIENLRAYAFPASDTGRPIGNLIPERFALLHFQAVGAAEDSPFSMSQGRSRIATAPVSSLSSADIDFEPQTITVVAAPETSQLAPQITMSVDTTEIQPVATLVKEETPVVDDGAILALDVNLYEDTGGAPGRLITDDTVNTGESFFLEITTEDLRDEPHGVGGLSVDVAWDPKILEEIDRPFDPADDNSNLVTDDLPLYRSGALDNQAGTITDLGGACFRSSGAGEPIGVDGPERFSLLHFRAIAAAEHSPISLEIGESGVGIVQGAVDDPGDVLIRSQSITVAEQVAPPRIEVGATSGPDRSTIQFTTVLKGDGENGTTPLVRPALPDTKQFVEVVNTGPSPLTIHQVLVQAPDVSVDVAPTADPADDLVIPPGKTQRFHLTYAPTAPSANNLSTQSFNVSDGLVILSDAENAPRIEVALVGESTYDADVTYDGNVNIADLVKLDDYFGLDAGDAAYDPAVDPNGDGSVDLGDFGPLNVTYRAARPNPQPVLLASPAQAAAIDAVMSETPPSDVGPDPSTADADSWLDAVATGWLEQAEEDGETEAQAPLPVVDPAALYGGRG